MGFYRTTCALVVTTFSTNGLSDPDSWFKNIFYQALYNTVQEHPSLCYGILDQTTEREAVFLRLQAIHRDDVAEFYDQDTQDPAASDDDLAITTLLERSHERLLMDGNRKPAWRVVVFKHTTQRDSAKVSKSQKVSIAFLANHAIADGLSHINFHRSLLRFFNIPKMEACVWPYNVPRDLRCPILLEDAVDLQSRDKQDRTQINYGSTSVWSGENIFLSSIDNYVSGLRFITVPETECKKVVKFSRSRNITLTGLIHGLLVTFLAKHVPADHAFLAVTPYSMRHLSKVTEYEICNHASALVHEFPASLVSRIRASAANSSEETDMIIEVGQKFCRDMVAELARSPKNNAWAGMFGISDWYSQSRAQLGKKRPLTYELSNLGNLKVMDSVQTTKDAPLKLDKMLVSQCGSGQ